MPARTFPNVGLKGGYDPHEGGWGDDQNLNLLKLSALVQGTVISKLSATPPSPTPPAVYLFDETHPDHPNEIGIFEGATGEEDWTYVVPEAGWLVYNQQDEFYEKFDGTVWAELETGGGGGASYPDFVGHAGEFLRVNATEDDVEWAGAGDAPGVTMLVGSEPTITGSDSLYSGSGATYNIPLPAGSAAGDVALILAGQGNAPYQTAGQDIAKVIMANGTNVGMWRRVLDATDISNGYVTATFSGSFNGAGTVLVFPAGQDLAIELLDVNTIPTSMRAAIYGTKPWLSPVAPRAGTLLTFIYSRQNTAITSTAGALLETVSGAAASCALYAVAVEEGGQIEQTINVPANDYDTVHVTVLVSALTEAIIAAESSGPAGVMVLRKQVNQTITTGAWRDVTWDNIGVDTMNAYGVVGDTDFTIPDGMTVMELNLKANWSGDGNKYLALLNVTTAVAAAIDIRGGVSESGQTMNTGLIPVTPGDVYRIQANSGTTTRDLSGTGFGGASVLTARFYESYEKAVGGVGGGGGGSAEYPPGGTTGQLLAKASGADNDVEWVDPPTGSTVGDAFAVSDTGTGSPQVITLPTAGLSPENVMVFVDGVYQDSAGYSITDDELTITATAAGDVQVVGPIGSSGGGVGSKGWWWDPPLAADWTGIGDFSGDGTVPVLTDDADVGLLLSTPVDGSGTGPGDKGRFFLKPIPRPAESWSLEWYMVADCSYPGAYPMLHGVCLVNTAKSKNVQFGFDMREVVYWGRFNIPSGYGGTEQQTSWAKGTPRFWKIEHDATGATLKFYCSANGKVWTLIRSTSNTDWLGETPKYIGLGFRMGSTNVGYTTSFTIERWIETNLD